MNQTLKNAIREVEALPEAEQEELMGGEIPHEEVLARIRARYAD